MRPQTDQLGAPLAWAPYTNLKAKMLLRRGTLDTLAALVLYWHDAKARNDNPQAEADDSIGLAKRDESDPNTVSWG